MNLSALPDQRAMDDPLGPAVADDKTDLDNAQFLGAVRRAAASLRSHGVSAGDVVAIMLPNTANFVVSMFAAWRLGAAVTPVNPSLRPAEVTYQVGDAGAKVLIVEKTPEFDASVPVLEADQLDNGAPGDDAPHDGEDALALLIYTSGTTGRPKGVMLDHANLDAMCTGVIDAFNLTAADHSLLILPLFHVNGIVVGTLSPLLAGGRATVAGRFRPESFFDRHRGKPSHLLLRRTNHLHDAVRAAREREAGHVVGALRHLRGGARQRRTAGGVRIPLRHPDHRGLRVVRGILRQHGQSAGRQAQARNCGTTRARSDDPHRRHGWLRGARWPGR